MDFGLICEFRNPAEWRRPISDVYDDTLGALATAEHLGFRAVEILEHHFVEDGYIPSPLIAAAAIAARTRTIRIASNVALLPLYNPVRFAEDCAVVDCISRGRLDVGVALGYRDAEYEGLGYDIRTRGARMDEAAQVVKGLWSGEPFSFHGRFFNLDGVRIAPQPVQSPTPPLWIGGFVPAGARRAARFGDGYTGLLNRELYDVYVEELARLGKDASRPRVRCSHVGFFAVSNTPEETFRRWAPHVTYWANSYAAWFETSDTKVFEKITSLDGLRASKLLTVLTPDDAIRYLKDVEALFPIETYSFGLAPPGFPPAEAMPHLELFAREVLPAFR